MAAPVAPCRPHHFTEHGETRDDSRAWLRDKADPAVDAYLRAENAYTAAVMAPTVPLQETLYAEMLSRIKQDDTSVPYRRAGFDYYSRTETGGQYRIYCRREAGADGIETVLLDLNALSAGHAFLTLGTFAVSDDGNLLAYSLDTTGYRQYTLFVRDLRTGDQMGAPIERVDDAVWLADDRTLVYVTQDAVTKRGDTVRRQTAGAPHGDVLFFEADDAYDVGIRRTREGAHIIITSTATDTTECRVLSALTPGDAPRVFAPRRDGIRYELDAAAGRFYIRTNEDAPDFRVLSVSTETAESTHRAIVVPERAGTTITGIELFAEFGAVLGRRDGLPSIEILDVVTHALAPLTFDEPDYVVELGDNEEYRTTSLRFVFESFTVPRSTFDLDVASGTRTLLKRTEISNFDASAYRTERRFERARDGTLVPVSIVQKAGVAHDGSAPLLLYGYGSYGVSIDAHFSPARFSLLDRGVIFAVAHIRGGGEYGEAWRIAGNLTNKLATFTDFIDVAQALIDARYTSPQRLVIIGGSAGGLLVGAVLNMRPELFAGALAIVPFVDVLTTMLDPTLPLTTGEYREWGNPHEPAAYAYMRRYSPLDNVGAQPYPALLVETSFNDSQTPYWEGAKFAVKVREHTTSGKPVLLKTNMDAGHGGSSGRFDKLRETAFEYAFVLDTLGIRE